MVEARKDAPRRYILNGAGQRVLIGLTNSETIEFERLDNPRVSLESASSLQEERHEERRPGQNESDRRWSELYMKHERAWSAWMAESRARMQPLHVLS
ncbi:MAG: hypothetical protein QHD01_14865 [Bradyrhizobium sp.]|nr:hypothetical protein [Bradyrhizobium sp.]